MDVFIAFVMFMSRLIVDRTKTHRCMTIVKAMQRMLSTVGTGPVDVEYDYDGDLHSLFVDRGVKSINDAMRVSMGVNYDLILKTICVQGCYEVSDIHPGTLYVADLCERDSIEQYTVRITYMHGLRLQLKSIVLKCEGYHFIALAMWGSTIIEYNDSQIKGYFDSWQKVIQEPRFKKCLVTSAWYYRHDARAGTEDIWNEQLNAAFT